MNIERDAVIAYLRGLTDKEFRETMELAAIALGWEDYDDEGCQVDVDEYETIEDADASVADSYLTSATDGGYLAHVGRERHLADVLWSVYPPQGGETLHGSEPTLELARAVAETAAMAVGWRLPWRNDTPPSL